MTIYVLEEPNTKPEIPVRLERRPTGSLALRVGRCVILCLTKDGMICRWLIDNDDAKIFGLSLNLAGFVKLQEEDEESINLTTIFDAIQAEREACARVAEEPETVSIYSIDTQINLRSRIADRIRARGETTESTKETPTNATLSKP